MRPNTDVTAYSESFIGQIDEIAVYATVATGAVSIVALDPYDGGALVLATNAAIGARTIWTPRLAEASDDGVAARSVTNAASADMFNAQGERFRMSITGGRTGVTYRARIKLRD